MSNYQLETRWANAVINYSRWVMLASIALVAVLSIGLRDATISSDYRYFFGEDNPQRQAFDGLQQVYSKDDAVLIVVTPEDGKVFKAETLAAIRYLTEASWKLPYVTRVDSVSNYQYSYAQEDDLIVQDLVTDSVLNSGTGVLSSLEQIALSEPELRGRLVNADASVTGINIKMMFPGNSPFEVPDAAQSARDLADEFARKFPGHAVHLTGMVMLNDAFNEAGIRDVMTLMPVMYLLITFMLWLILRTVAGVVMTLAVMVLSILGAMGFSGWMGIPITPPSSIAPTVIMTLAIAHSVHILKTLLKVLTTGTTRNEAIIESVRQNLKPVFLTSLTTIVGFLSLNFSDTPPFHDLGNITAVGVALSFLLSVGFLPAWISRIQIQPGHASVNENPLSSRYAAWVSQHSKPIILIMIGLTGFLGMQIGSMKINDQFVGYFDNTIRFRPDSEYTIEQLTGVYLLNFDLKSGEAGGVSNPEYLRTVDNFARYMETIDDVVHVSTITETFKRLNRNMHADDPAMYRLPEERNLAAQYLLLYEMSLPYGLDLNNRISVDKSSSRMIVTLGNVPTSRILEIASQATSWLRSNAPAEMYTEPTSPTAMFSHITERNVYAMLWGTAVALVLITLVMIASLRSIRYGLASLLPNVIPALLSIGLWALLVGEAGFSIAFVASVTLGIIVDDTVHFLSKFQYARNIGHDAEGAVRYALKHVGAALIATSMVLIVGFSVLMLSGFKLNFVLGALSALTIAIALLVDFTLLPAVLLLLNKSTTESEGGTVKMKYAVYVVMSVILGAGASTSMDVLAQTPEEKGLWVAESADQYDAGFFSQSADVTMILRNSYGHEATRQLRIRVLEMVDDGDKSLTIFDTPPDVEGTAFLSYSHAQKADDQWLYLPSLKRVKRISSSNKSGPFMGSEFAYEDLASQEIDKYTYRYLASDVVDGETMHVIARYPVDKNSGYARQIVRLDGSHWRTHQIEYYDRKDTLLKTLKYENYRQYPNGKWRADSMQMENHQTGKSTTLDWRNIEFGVDMSEGDFTTNALKRIR